MRKLMSLIIGWLSCLLVTAVAFGGEQDRTALVFDLEEVSVFDDVTYTVGMIYGGQRETCVSEPDPTVKVHPAFNSKKPLYGSVRFGRELEKPDSGMQFHFAIDESKGTDSGYDRLYFDLNRDLDLANDAPFGAQERPPGGALIGHPSIEYEQQVCFDYVHLNFDFGSYGERPVEIMPRLVVYEDGYESVSFVTTKARKAEIELAGKLYDVVLGHDYSVGGRLDEPWTAFRLISKDEPSSAANWWGSDRLAAMHRIEGDYYSFSTTPIGDRLIVRPYDGPLGTFEVGPGGRDIEVMQASGSLSSKDANLALGGELEHGWPKKARSCTLPVGDYLPLDLSVDYGRLRIFASDNYHSDGKPRDRGGRPRVYGIAIREDKPFVLDFSNNSEVLFALPAKGHRVKLGETVEVKAVLVDPKLDIMIRRLDDTTRKQKREYTTPDGETRSSEVNLSLDPKVLITRLDGETVAEGLMPFG